jgi:hypothetical protein
MVIQERALQVIQRKTGAQRDKWDAYYTSPTGGRARSKIEVWRLLTRTSEVAPKVGTKAEKKQPKARGEDHKKRTAASTQGTKPKQPKQLQRYSNAPPTAPTKATPTLLKEPTTQQHRAVKIEKIEPCVYNSAVPAPTNSPPDSTAQREVLVENLPPSDNHKQLEVPLAEVAALCKGFEQPEEAELEATSIEEQILSFHASRDSNRAAMAHLIGEELGKLGKANNAVLKRIAGAPTERSLKAQRAKKHASEYCGTLAFPLVLKDGLIIHRSASTSSRHLSDVQASTTCP